MNKKWLLQGLLSLFCFQGSLQAHCQMPCGIYHDDMVYDQIDQYAETMYKGISVMNNSKFDTVRDKNEFMRWVMQKEEASNEAADLILKFFLQQKIKPNEPDTVKRLVCAHNLLCMIVLIKQNTELKFVDEFMEEWDKFKLMFHVEGYECKVEALKLKKRELLKKKLAESEQHSHDHDHEHDHEHSH